MKQVIIIARNRRAYYQYFIQKEFEAGLCLQGWETKSLRAGNADISNSYVLIKNNEVYLFGAIFQPLITVSFYQKCNPKRVRKLLINKIERNNLIYSTIQKKLTVVALLLYWKRSWAKMKIGIAKGKKIYDKRATIKLREWKVDKNRFIKYSNR